MLDGVFRPRRSPNATTLTVRSTNWDDDAALRVVRRAAAIGADLVTRASSHPLPGAYLVEAADAGTGRAVDGYGDEEMVRCGVQIRALAWHRGRASAPHSRD